MANLDGVQRLCEVMKRLRAPGGCPWDRAQTVASLKPCVLEETYELLQAMDADSIPDHVEELGDVLLQVVFQCEIREEEGKFSLNDVANALCEKLIRRHPHVFGDVKVDNVAQVLKNWENIKKGETHGNPARSALDGVPPALPALLKAQRVQAKASRVGFDWKDSSGAIEKVDEELSEVKEAIASKDTAAITDEIGDLFFALVNVCRFLNVDAESAMSAATKKFSDRFRLVEEQARKQGIDMKSCSLDALDVLWETAKKTLRPE